MKSLKEIIQEVRTHSENRDRKALTAALRPLLAARRAYYRQSLAEQSEEAFSDALYKMLWLELDEAEEDSIELAELAYLSLCKALLRSPAVIPEQYKRRLLLLHYFSDYLTDAVICVFLSKYRTENILQARNLALECLEKMQLSDLFCLEENAPEYLNGDGQLTEACNAIETASSLSGKEKAEALLMHKVLFAYLQAKYSPEREASGK